MSTTEREERVAGPDWKHDPRDTEAVHARRARHTRWTRIAAVIVAVLLVVGGTVFVGFVTGRISLPVLGTLTPHPASVAVFPTQGTTERTTYLMQEQTSGSIRVMREVDNDINRVQVVADLAQPDPGAISATSDPTRTTYFVVLPPGAHDVKAEPKDPTATVTDVIAAVPDTQSGPGSVGLVATVHTAAKPGTGLVAPGLAAVKWVDADGTAHTSSLPG